MFSFQGASEFLISKRLNETSFVRCFSQSLWLIHSSLLLLTLEVVGQNGLEPSTSRLSVVCSSQLSYWPISRRHKLHIPRFGHFVSKAHSLRCVSSPNQILRIRFGASSLLLVEISGIEPLTSCLQGRRSPSWAKPPYVLHHLQSTSFPVPSKLNNEKFLTRCTDL